MMKDTESEAYVLGSIIQNPNLLNENEFNKILIKLQKGVSKEFFAPLLLHAASQLAATKKIIKVEEEENLCSRFIHHH